MVEFEGKGDKQRQRGVIGKDGEEDSGRSCDKTERSERGVSDMAAVRYPMMEGLEGSRGRRTGEEVEERVDRYGWLAGGSFIMQKGQRKECVCVGMI